VVVVVQDQLTALVVVAVVGLPPVQV